MEMITKSEQTVEEYLQQLLETVHTQGGVAHLAIEAEPRDGSENVVFVLHVGVEAMMPKSQFEARLAQAAAGEDSDGASEPILN